MWLTERGFGEAAIIDVHGALTGSAASELLQITVRAHLGQGSRVLILNLADMTAIDQEGVNTLTAVAMASRRQRVELRVAGDPRHLTEAGVALRPAGYRIYATADDALSDVRQALEQRHSRLAGGTLQRVLAALRRIVWDS